MNEKSKYRVIGAVALVVIALSLIPFLLKRPVPPVRVVHTPSSPPGVIAASRLSVVSVQKTALKTTSYTQAHTVQTIAAAPKAVFKTVSSRPTPQSKPAVGWVVQVGSFSNLSYAKHFVSQLRSRGFHARVYPLHTQTDKRYQVVIGPALKDHARAQKRLLRWRSTLKHLGAQGFLVKLL